MICRAAREPGFTRMQQRHETELAQQATAGLLLHCRPVRRSERRGKSCPAYRVATGEFQEETFMLRPSLTLALGAGLLVAALGAQAQNKLKVGFMLPYTGTYAALGTAIENGFRLHVQELGGKLGGREIEYFKVD